MPRTNGVYTPPAGTKGVPDTTIRSAPYNALVDDLTAEANDARPITAGGTGATNATDARENLGALASADVLSALLKDSPVDADGVVVTDSEDSGKLKRVLWSKVKAVVNLASVGASMAAANGKATPADGDFFGGVLAGGSTMFKTTWANIKTALQSIFYTKTEVNTITSSNMSGRAYPRRSDGGALNFVWSGQARNPSYVWGIDEPGNNAYPHPPANLSVGWANSAGNANTVGGWSQATIADQLNWRITDTRFDGYFAQEAVTSGSAGGSSYGSSGYVVTFVNKRAGVTVLDIGLRQPQRYIPNQGWRALGGW